MPTKTLEVTLCPAELTVAPRMHQNMQLETRNLNKISAPPRPSLNVKGIPFPHTPTPIVSARASSTAPKSKSWIRPRVHIENLQLQTIKFKQIVTI